MNPPKACPRCNSLLPENAPAGICPKCLLQAGLEQGNGGPSVAPTVASGQAFEPPDPQTLADYFPQLQMEQLIGQGGMGAVYRARQTKLDRLVALKIIRPESAQDSMFAERFNREARTLARLNHANIVGVFDFGEVQFGADETTTLYYFIMEYVDGATLRQLITAGELTSTHALSIVPQICEALQYAHDEGVIHRDIKPENILVDSKGQVKIADFGLAKLMSDNEQDFTLTHTHQVMGTPRYMAPEQMAATRAVDHRADIYSLGVVFYEMLTGDLPMGRFDPPSQKSTVDRQWDDIVLRALENEPQKRYQHASEVKSDLERVASAPYAAEQMPAKPFVQPPPAAHAATGDFANDGPTKPHFGLLIQGGVMTCLGLLILAIGMAERGGFVFIWVGLGIALGGGGIASGAFSNDKRLPAGIVPNYGLCIQGGIMILTGMAMILFCYVQRNNSSLRFHLANPLVWVGLGVTLGGGGCFAGAWSANSEPVVSSQRRRHSRKAIVAACWAPFFFVAVVLFLFVSDVRVAGDDATQPQLSSANILTLVLAFTVLPLGVSAPFGTTILGIMAIGNIRHSQGEIVGMPLAVADALLFPLLILDGVIIALCATLTWVPFPRGEQDRFLLFVLPGVLAGALICALVDFWLIRMTWRAATNGLKRY